MYEVDLPEILYTTNDTEDLGEYVVFKTNIIRQLVEYLRELPRRPMDRQNLWLGFGATNKQHSIYVALIYMVTATNKETNEMVDEYEYAIITRDEVVPVYCKVENHKLCIEYNSDVKYASDIYNVLEYIHTHTMNQWQRKVKIEDKNIRLSAYNEQMKDKYLGD